MEVAGVVLSGVQTGLSLAQTMFSALQCRELKQICSILGYESELEKLQGTVSTIRAALLDVEAKEANQELSHQERDWVEKLKDALYDADDLLDEYATLARRQQLLEGENEVSKKEQVRSWFSLSPLKKVNDALNLSLGVQGIRKKLDAIASDYSKFGFKVNNEPIRRRREETCSYVDAEVVIGREDDKNAIVDMLLDPNYVQRDVSFITIVGVGGLGKTTLAQIVYNDERVRKEFPLRAWACVSDDDKKPLDIKAILCKLLESATHQKHDDFVFDVVQRKLLELLVKEKYLLVLDDVWSENPVELRKLCGFLTGGQKGGWVVVTTRSNETARVIGTGDLYELKSLSEKDSWQLFEMAAFGEGQEQPNSELIEIGKKIVGKCVGVPLAIRVVGSLLYGQGESLWLSYLENGIAYTGKGTDDIMSILKFSYYHLESSLKSCFSLCALFPKDFVMDKEILIMIWMAHGCVVPFHEGQSIEDAAEEHFSILLRRCFFQDVVRDRFGEIYSCKVHDLMHDIAQSVAGKEIFIADSITGSLDNKVRHLILTQAECAENLIMKTKLRTYIHAYDGCYGWRKNQQNIPVGKILSSWVCVRVLDLRAAGIESLPDTIGKLVHLRYLDLSNNFKLQTLPQSITKLYNLQALLLQHCSKLRELPKDLGNLVQLRVLDLEGCRELTCMPSSIKELTCLRILNKFVVGSTNSSLDKCIGGLEALKALTSLKGILTLYIKKIVGGCTYDKEKARRGGYLKAMQHLKEVTLCFKDEDDDASGDHTEALVEGLEPHPNLQALILQGYNGVRVPSWTERLTSLAIIHLEKCPRLRYLPSLGKLPHLKRLDLERLGNLEWMENSSAVDFAAAAAEPELFFPSLEELTLRQLPELKGWWRSDDSSMSSGLLLPSFPCLCRLQISDCPRLTSVPLCPSLVALILVEFNESLWPIMRKNNQRGKVSSSSSSPSLSASVSASSSLLSDICSNSGNSKSRRVLISNVGYLNSLPMEAFQCLTEMDIYKDEKVESLSEVEEVFRSCSSSLRSLSINCCSKLRSLGGGGLDHLTAVESLEIQFAHNLDMIEDEEEDDGMPWRSLQHSLRSLKLRELPKLVELPKGMHHLTSLQSLSIYNCENLKCLPEWGSCLSSLRSIKIVRCENLQGLPEWVCCSPSLHLDIE